LINLIYKHSPQAGIEDPNPPATCISAAGNQGGKVRSEKARASEQRCRASAAGSYATKLISLRTAPTRVCSVSGDGFCQARDCESRRWRQALRRKCKAIVNTQIVEETLEWRFSSITICVRDASGETWRAISRCWSCPAKTRRRGAGKIAPIVDESVRSPTLPHHARLMVVRAAQAIGSRRRKRLSVGGRCWQGTRRIWPSPGGTKKLSSSQGLRRNYRRLERWSRMLRAHASMPMTRLPLHKHTWDVNSHISKATRKDLRRKVS